MEQVLVNWLLGALGAVLGFLMNQVWQAVKDLQKADENLTDKVARVELLVAGNYVKKAELDVCMTRVFDKLVSIENKLDTKADK